MPSVKFIDHDGTEHVVEARTGLSLMENAIANGIDGIEAVCGGNAYCATCRVYPEPEWRNKLGERNELEVPMLEEVGDAESHARLSCQLEVTEAFDGLVVRLPESQS